MNLIVKPAFELKNSQTTMAHKNIWLTSTMNIIICLFYTRKLTSSYSRIISVQQQQQSFYSRARKVEFNRCALFPNE